VRPAAFGGDPVLVLLNFGAAAEPTVDRDPALEPFLGAGVLEDALTGDRVRLDPEGPMQVKMPGFSVRILVPAGGGA
jgi:hypothetical protein